ncbi:MAG: ESX secretion-associated protein EspG [Sciscionella sp.]
MTIFGADLGQQDVREPITISALEFDVLTEYLALGEMPVVLRVPSPGSTNTERNQLVSSAWASLQAKGYGRAVDLDPRLRHMLGVLARPDSEVDGRLWLDGEIRLLAALRGEHAVLATMRAGNLTLREAAPTGLPREALTVLPSRDAGQGVSITLPSARFEAAAAKGTTPEAFEAALREFGLRAEDAKQLRAMIGDVTGQGQFGAAARDKWGARHRADHVVSFFETEGGRYMQIRRESTADEPWSTISPVDARRMNQHVTTMYQEALVSG